MLFDEGYIPCFAFRASNEMGFGWVEVSAGVAIAVRLKLRPEKLGFGWVEVSAGVAIAVRLKLRPEKLIKILCVEIFQFIFIRIKDMAKGIIGK
ncbi:hypothetical protein QE152_g25760 [Popillia japonica]|uniref:Uncharacterized protein n=1 Tax=Popillia japonica TaxID=7064 RepID=A0AAW1K1T6_POPJA